MPAASELSIVNLVLAKLARSPVTNVNDSPASLLIAQQLPTMYQSVLLKAFWTFAMKFRYDNTPLTTSVMVNPIGGFLYNYQLPADYGRFGTFVFDVFPNYGTPYLITDGVILISARPIAYWYVVNDVPYSLLPAPFIEALAYYVAAEVTMPLTQNESLAKYNETRAEQRMGDAIQQNYWEQALMQTSNNDFNRRTLI